MTAPPTRTRDPTFVAADDLRPCLIPWFSVAALRPGDLYRRGPRGHWQIIPARPESLTRLIEESRTGKLAAFARHVQ